MNKVALQILLDSSLFILTRHADRVQAFDPVGADEARRHHAALEELKCTECGDSHAPAVAPARTKRVRKPRTPKTAPGA